MYSSEFSGFIAGEFKVHSFSKIKKGSLDMEVEDPRGLLPPAGGNKEKTVQSREEQDETKKLRQAARRQWLEERRHYVEIVPKACRLKHIMNP